MAEENQSQDNQLFVLNEFYEKNKKSVLVGLGVIIVLFAGYFYYTKVHLPEKEETAQGELFMAQRYFGMDSLDLVLNGDGNALGAPEVADNYSGTPAGNLAAFYAGRTYMEKGQFEEALDYLDGVSFSDEIMSALVICLRGDCHAELGNYEKAASLYWEAAEQRDNKFTAPYSYIKAGRAYSEIENWDKAAEAYRIVVNEYPDYSSSLNIKKMMAFAEAKAGE
jgi:tetratricopeptide (TPR) repeat protein